MIVSGACQLQPSWSFIHRQSLPQKKWLLLFSCIGAWAIFCWGLTTQTLLLKCQSDSLSNISYLFVWKGKSFEGGDIVYIQGHRVKYTPRATALAKRVLGLPGDIIERSEEGVRLIHKDQSLSPLLFPLLKQTSKGEPLSPSSFTIIPEGYVFVAGDHPKSFDSRYDEFGLVNIENIRGRAIWWW